MSGQGLEQGRGAGLQKLTDAGQLAQACGQGGEVPASGGAVHHPADEPLQVGDLPQLQRQLLPGDDVLHQIAHRLLPPGDLHRGEEGPLHPAPDQSVAHGGFRLIHHPQQGALLFLAPQGLGELQSLPGGEVQLHKLARGVVGEGGDVAQIGLLGVVEVAQHPAGGLDGGGVAHRQGLQPGGKLLVYQFPGVVQGETLLLPVLAHAVQAVLQKVGEARQRPGALGEHRLGGVEAAQLIFQVVQGLRSGREGGGKHLAGGDVAQAQAYPGLVGVDGAEEVVFPLLQHRRGDDGARRDDADDVPVHQTLGQGGVLGLLTDGHLVALGDEPGDVALTGVVGHAAHGGALLRGLISVPGGEGQIQLLGHQLGIVEEHLIKIAQSEKQNGVGIAVLHLQVLFHHGGQFCHGFTVFLRCEFLFSMF